LTVYIVYRKGFDNEKLLKLIAFCTFNSTTLKVSTINTYIECHFKAEFNLTLLKNYIKRINAYCDCTLTDSIRKSSREKAHQTIAKNIKRKYVKRRMEKNAENQYRNN
jgi:hypothetical protein